MEGEYYVSDTMEYILSYFLEKLQLLENRNFTEVIPHENCQKMKQVFTDVLRDVEAIYLKKSIEYTNLLN